MRNFDAILTNIGKLHTCANNGKPKKGKEMANTGVIADVAVAISAGKIAAITDSKTAQNTWNAPDIVDCGGKTVIPGLVDCHTHIVYAGNRAAEFEQRIAGATYMEIMAAGGGIMSSARAVRSASVEDLVAQALPRLEDMAKLGVITVEIKTGYGLTTTDEMKMLAAIETLAKRSPLTIVPTFLGAHAIPSEYREQPDTYVQIVLMEMLPAAKAWYEGSIFKQKGIPFYCDVFCENNAFTLSQSRQILSYAKELGLGIKIHSDEFTSLGGIPLGLELGASSVDHLDAATEQDIRTLAGSEAVGVLLPGVNFNLGSTHYANARLMIESGCAIALSTDINPGSCPSPSLPLMMAIASRYQRVTPAEALNACTINAAFAIGLGSSHGSIEVGKAADLALLRSNDYRTLSYEFGGNPIETVWKDGKVL